MIDDETIALHVTVIGGARYPNDFTVFWRGLPIGRIMKSTSIRDTTVLTLFVAQRRETELEKPTGCDLAGLRGPLPTPLPERRPIPRRRYSKEELRQQLAEALRNTARM